MSLDLKYTASKCSPQSFKAPTQCPYHTDILNLIKFPSDNLRGKDAITHFLSEGPDEQPAIFNQPDNNKTSIDKAALVPTKSTDLLRSFETLSWEILPACRFHRRANNRVV